MVARLYASFLWGKTFNFLIGAECLYLTLLSTEVACVRRNFIWKMSIMVDTVPSLHRKDVQCGDAVSLRLMAGDW